MALCSKEDVKGLMTSHITQEAWEDASIETAIEASEAEIYAHITPCYHTSCPFADPVPPILRWDCARLAYGMLIAGQTGPSEPNKTDYGIILQQQIRDDLEKIVMCEKGVYNQDGSLVKRDIPCPEGSPNSNSSSTNIITSSFGLDSEDDITAFSTRDNPRK